jgi:hypothetical protein
MFDFVRALLRVLVYTSHTFAIRGASNASLYSVDVIVETIEGAATIMAGRRFAKIPRL